MSYRLTDTDRHFSKICLKPCETKIDIQACKAILDRIKSIPCTCRPTRQVQANKVENSEA